MKPLDEVYEVLHQVLLETNRQWEAMRHDMNEFISIVSKLPAAMVKVRLTTIACQIMIQTSFLRKQHGEKGYVFVMVSSIVLGVHWAEKEYSTEDKNWFKSRGSLIVSPETICIVVEHFIDQIDSGQWAKAVEWINRYEPSVVYDATKLP